MTDCGDEHRRLARRISKCVTVALICVLVNLAIAIWSLFL